VGSVSFTGHRFGMLRSLCCVAFALVFTDVLSGCAVYNMYEKCGSYGCSGDATISATILAGFRQHSELEPNAINVQTLDHVVYLYGVVSSSLEIDTAESIARKVSGVQEVVNSVVAQTR
jgi:osmotically-inducible protein OsmY